MQLILLFSEDSFFFLKKRYNSINLKTTVFFVYDDLCHSSDSGSVLYLAGNKLAQGGNSHEKTNYQD